MSIESKLAAARQEYDSNDLTHQVYYALKREILVGKLPAMEKLNVVRLAKQYNVSRTPVTQALELLKQDDLIEQLPGKRATVKTLSPQEISTIYLFRKQLEPVVAKLSLHVIPESEPLALKKLVENLMEHPELLDKSIQLDERLHSMLWRHLRSPLVDSLFSTINEYSVRLQSYTTYAIEQISSNCEEHLNIINAVLTRDPEGIVQAVELHLDRSCQRLLSFCRGS